LIDWRQRSSLDPALGPGVHRGITQRAAQEELDQRERLKRQTEKKKKKRRDYAQQQEVKQEAAWLAHPMRASVLARS